MNAYHNATFFSFFQILIKRLGLFLLNDPSLGALSADEIQLLVLLPMMISCCLIGLFLILRQMTMLANALSHTILVGVVLAYLIIHSAEGAQLVSMSALTIGAFFSALLTTLCVNFLNRQILLANDASIGFVFTTLFALGIVLATTLTRSSHIGIEIMMGNVDGLLLNDVSHSFITMLFNIAIIGLLFKGFAIVSFDVNFARLQGVSTLFFDYLLMFLVSLTAIVAFKAIGILMFLSMVTGPILIARQWFNRLVPILIVAITTRFAAIFIGVALSRHIFSVYGIALSTGAIIVCLLAIIFFITQILSLWISWYRNKVIIDQVKG